MKLIVYQSEIWFLSCSLVCLQQRVQQLLLSVKTWFTCKTAVDANIYLPTCCFVSMLLLHHQLFCWSELWNCLSRTAVEKYRFNNELLKQSLLSGLQEEQNGHCSLCRKKDEGMQESGVKESIKEMKVAWKAAQITPS